MTNQNTSVSVQTPEKSKENGHILKPYRFFIVLLLCTLWGCKFNRGDLDKWKSVANGGPRLAGYVADPNRPQDLRTHAAENLFELGELKLLMSALVSCKGDDQVQMLAKYADLAAKGLKNKDDAVRGFAAGLAFQLLRYTDKLTDATPLIEASTDWALEWFGKPGKPSNDVSVHDLLQAVALSAPEQLRSRVVAHLATVQSENVLLELASTLAKVKDPTLQSHVASALLARARALFPKIPITLAEAMVANRNPTLLRFLLEAARDQRVAPSVRNLGVIAADRFLGRAAIPGWLRLAAATDSSGAIEHRLNAIDLVWKYGGTEKLDELLRSLPTEGWPKDDASLKGHIDEFCDNHVARAETKARLILVNLLASPKWITRIYAMDCIIRLYPDDAPDILESLVEDTTPLLGWSDDGPTTIGAVARSVSEG